MPDSASIKAFGINLMDPRHRPGATKAGLAQGSEGGLGLSNRSGRGRPFGFFGCHRLQMKDRLTKAFRTANEGSIPSANDLSAEFELERASCDELRVRGIKNQSS